LTILSGKCVQNTKKYLRGFEPNNIASAASLQGAPREHLAEAWGEAL